MDARNPAARRAISGLADLAGAVRLPSGGHQRAAGTGVVTDLLVLRRREPGRAPDPAAWEQARMTELDGAQVPVNEYFLDHPGAVLELGAVHGAYRADDLVVRPAGDAAAALDAAMKAMAATARSRGLMWAAAPVAVTGQTGPRAESAFSPGAESASRAAIPAVSRPQLHGIHRKIARPR